MERVVAEPGALPFGFVAPESAAVSGIALRALIDAALRDDLPALAALRAQCGVEPAPFDDFVGGVRRLGAGEPAVACSAFARLESTRWSVPAAVLHALALAAAGELRAAIALRNRLSDRVLAAPEAPSHAGDAALLREGARCLQRAEAAAPPAELPRDAAPCRYVVGYPRSGNSLLLQFLAYAFASPTYTVYPAARRYFSRRFAEPEPGHRVFVKDHVFQPEYRDGAILSPVRDGRTAIVSLARYLYAEGGHRFVRRGELADFISFVATAMPYGFWGSHTRALLDARERGAQVRLVRYEEIFGDHAQLVALARELGGGAAAPREDEAGFADFVATEKRRLGGRPEWSTGIALPADSFIPPSWSIGGETIDWRRAFDALARRRFHELGGTEALIRLGYETDENWWRGD
jgi:hypothetical protein